MAKSALCIGINNYPGTNADLSGCVSDAEDWARALTVRGFEVDFLFDSNATGKRMRQAVRRILDRAKAGDSVVIQYSGHGSFIPDTDGDEADGTDECLCPYDVRAEGYITDDELFSLYTDRARGVHLLMISDSCHSGGVARYSEFDNVNFIGKVETTGAGVRFLPPATFLPKEAVSALGTRGPRRSASPPGRNAGLLLAACQDTEVAYDAYFNGKPNGAFSYVALRALGALSKKSNIQGLAQADSASASESSVSPDSEPLRHGKRQSLRMPWRATHHAQNISFKR